MARIKQIDPASVKEAYERLAALDVMGHQPGFYSGAYPQPMAPLIATLMVELGSDITGKAEFRRRMEIFRRTGRPTIDELRRALGLTLEYVEGVFAGWDGVLNPADTRPDFVTGYADGLAARQSIAQ